MRLHVSIAGLLAVPLILSTGNIDRPEQETPNKPKSQPSTSQPAKEEPTIVKVKQGDTLTKIAKAHKTTYVNLFYANPSIEHPDVIQPGDKIRIPDPDEELNKRPLPADAAPEATKNAGSSSTSDYQPRAKASYPAPSNGSVWDRLAQCESGGNWHINTGNGYYGGLQFSLPTWRAVGGSGYPHQASREEQIARGKILQARSGWGQWPACSSKLGLH